MTLILLVPSAMAASAPRILLLTSVHHEMISSGVSLRRSTVRWPSFQTVQSAHSSCTIHAEHSLCSSSHFSFSFCYGNWVIYCNWCREGISPVSVTIQQIAESPLLWLLRTIYHPLIMYFLSKVLSFSNQLSLLLMRSFKK